MQRNKNLKHLLYTVTGLSLLNCSVEDSQFWGYVFVHLSYSVCSFSHFLYLILFVIKTANNSSTKLQTYVIIYVWSVTVLSLSLSVRNDLLMVCRQLNMEESVAEIMGQLGADDRGRISFQDFTRCRMQLVSEIRKEEGHLSLLSSDSEKRKHQEHVASWPTSSENSLGVLLSW